MSYDEKLIKALRDEVIAWSVCASIHREYAKGKDALFTTRQADFVRRQQKARAALREAKGMEPKQCP